MTKAGDVTTVTQDASNSKKYTVVVANGKACDLTVYSSTSSPFTSSITTTFTTGEYTVKQAKVAKDGTVGTLADATSDTAITSDVGTATDRTGVKITATAAQADKNLVIVYTGELTKSATYLSAAAAVASVAYMAL